MIASRLSKHNTAYLLLILYCIVAILPVLLLLTKSFFVDGQLSLEYYTLIFSEARLLRILVRSLLLATWSTGASLLLGLPFAYFLIRYNFYGKRLLSFLYLIPLFIPSHIHALAWIGLCGEKGLLNQLLMHLFSLDSPVLNIYTFSGAALVLFLSYFPLMVLLITIGLQGIDRRLEEVASFSYSPFAVLRKITLPLIFPYILSGILLVFMFSFFNYGVPSMLRIHSYPEEIFIRYSAFYDNAGAAALATPIIGLAIGLIILQVKYFKDKKYITLRTGSFASFPKNNTVSIYLYSIITISVFLPIAVLFLQAGNLMSFKLALENSFQDFQTTLFVAAIAATCATIFSYFIVHFTEYLPPIQKTGLELLTFIPFAFPATFVGIGLIYLWNTETTGFIYGSWAILILASLARFLPFTIRIMDVSSKQLDPKLREAACFCKSSVLKKLYYIDIPLIRRGILTCWIVTFIFCTGELGTTLLLIPPGSGTVSLKIYTLMHYGAGPLVAALALLLIAANLIVSTGLFLPSRTKQVRRTD